MPTHHQGTEAECRALNTYIKLFRAVDSLAARISVQLAAADLTWSQFGALEALYHLGPMCQSELGNKLLKSGGNITLVVDNLEKRDLVRRERNTDDRRFVTVHLTPGGKKLIHAHFPQHVASIMQEMSVLTATEQEELGRLCRKLGRQERSVNQAAGASGENKRSKSRARKAI